MKRCCSILIATIVSLVLVGAQAKSHATVLFSDNFANDSTFNTNLWYSLKGNPRIYNQRLLLESSPGNGCDATSRATFQYAQVQIKTPSYGWHEDTSIGFETWTPGHEGVVVTAGCLGCINDTLSGNKEYYVPIPNWANLASGDNVYLIKWLAPTSQNPYATALLYINGAYSCSYTGPEVPLVPCNVRMNSSNDYYDNLQVAYVTVSSN
jgi:hypothetical protein